MQDIQVTCAACVGPSTVTVYNTTEAQRHRGLSRTSLSAKGRPNTAVRRVDRPVVREASAISHRHCRPTTNGGRSNGRTRGFGQVPPTLPSNHQPWWIDPSYERLRPSPTDTAVQPPTVVDRPVVREASAKSHRSCRPTTNGGGWTPVVREASAKSHRHCRPTTNGGGSTRRTGGFGQVPPTLPSNHQRWWIDPSYGRLRPSPTDTAVQPPTVVDRHPSYERLRPSPTDTAVQPPTAVDRPVVREASAKSHRSCRPTTNGGGSTRRTGGFGQVPPTLPSNQPSEVCRPVVREASAKSHRHCRPTTNGGGSTRRTRGFGQVPPTLPSNHQRWWIDPSYERLRPSPTDTAVQPPTVVDRREASARVSPIMPSNHQRR